MFHRSIGAIGILVASLGVAAADEIDTTPAKILFSRMNTPIEAQPRSIGSYARGCLAGAVALPVTGPDWQAMRLSRNRNWGTPELIAFTEELAASAKKLDGWTGLLVGDMGQPRGGPALTGHASHQIGLDVDIWLTPMPKRVLSAEEREKLAATSMVDEKARRIDPAAWTSGRTRLVRRAALDPRVARIFVNAAIKKELCLEAGADRGWLNKVRPWWGHTYHMHVRLACPAGMASCVGQKPPPPGDGCGAELDSWLQPPKPVKPTKPTKPPVKPRQVMLSDLPAPCREVLLDAPPGVPPKLTVVPANVAAMPGDDGGPSGADSPADAAAPGPDATGTVY